MPHINPIVLSLVVVITAAVYFFSFEKEPVGDIATTDAIVLPEQNDQPAQENAKPPIVSNANIAAPISREPGQHHPAGDEKVLALPDTNPNYATFGDRYSEISARRQGNVPDPHTLLTASKAETAWEPTDAASQTLNLTEEELNDGREFIQFNPLKLESLVAGDRFEISLSQTAKTYTVIIEDVQMHDAGRNVTWRGRVEGIDGFNQVTLTRGNDLVVGGITTPDGYFQLQAHGDHGWIANSATLFKGVDQQVVVPPELIKNPPKDVVYLPVETFGDAALHTH